MQPIGTYSGGTLYRHPDLTTHGLLPRHVDVWCPPGYEANAAAYPVIYLHDGQNLFDPATAFIGVDWGMDEALTRLMAEGVTTGALMVGVWNSTQRRRDYMPEQPLQLPAAHAIRAAFEAENGGPAHSDAYGQFLVKEVKPLIDATYRTLPDAAHTFIMGSSMGGLISLYTLARYPHIFSGAGCLSTHWVIGGDVLVDALGALVPRAGTHKIYFDYGTETLDADYEPFQRRMDTVMQAAGYVHGADWLTRKFPGAEHSERAWRARVDEPLRFLLAKD